MHKKWGERGSEGANSAFLSWGPLEGKCSPMSVVFLVLPGTRKTCLKTHFSLAECFNVPFINAWVDSCKLRLYCGNLYLHLKPVIFSFILPDTNMKAFQHRSEKHARAKLTASYNVDSIFNDTTSDISETPFTCVTKKAGQLLKIQNVSAKQNITVIDRRTIGLLNTNVYVCVCL